MVILVPLVWAPAQTPTNSVAYMPNTRYRIVNRK